MATWGLHMRVAEKFLGFGYDLEDTYFLVGNIGPDCGVPNEDWSQFTPPNTVSHWSNGNNRSIQEEKFRNAYLEQHDCDKKERSFLLGYYVHLLTDKLYVQMIDNKIEQDENYAPLQDDKSFIWTIKKDWYDLDHKYFRDYQENIFQKIFQHIKDFPDYLDYYPKGAVQRQVNFITNFYQNPTETLDREYVYLSEKEMNSFINEAVEKIKDDLEFRHLI